ncbi:MAG TPA: primosomal protein N' [Thermoanaerobaculia bacterium]|nr:primosomal protein N' [Thermoanaerobaculia bacterium]
MTAGISRWIEVAVPLGVQGTFTYAVPEALQAEVRLGSRVEVPWGRKVTTGFVTAILDAPRIERERVKEIRGLLDEEEPALLPEILELCRRAADYYLAPVGEMLRAALPPNMAARGRRKARVVGGEEQVRRAVEASTVLVGDLELLERIRGGEGDPAKLVAAFRGARGALARLSGSGLVSIDEALRDARGVRYDRWISLGAPIADPTPKQRIVLELLGARGGEATHQALAAAGASLSAIDTLVRRGALVVERRHRRHAMEGYAAGLDGIDRGALRYSDEQRSAVESVRARLGSFAPFLLEGVTGSGKTEVYVELMREVVRGGRQAIVLVPEIGLTPVLAARLMERFGDRIAILHSGLSASEKYDQWWRARRGAVDVAIGPRSAIFTPFQRLGIVVVDEEGDSAYKQEESPRYNGRDLAVLRAQIAGIPVVLGSATPSLESRENAETGRYGLLRLTSRVEARPLPEVEVVDIRKEKGEKEDRGLVIFSERLREELARVFSAGEQAIILINRRGYAPFLLCRECENDFRCRDCSVTMTVHRRVGQLICHYCGLRRPIPPSCPLCQGEVLQPIGYGTEKVEERFRRYFPDVACEVLDRDSIRRRGELVRILDRFGSGRTRALIGTQIISKGHHFPGVTLTAVISADSILGYPDFRSAEKTFYLLTQVAGRSGRGDRPGKVVIQSAFPHHYAIQHAIRQDYEAFYRAEIEFRRRFHYPPTSSMIALLFRGEELEAVERAAARGGELLEKAVAGIRDVRIQGPAPAPLARIKGVWRYQILVRSAHRPALRRAVERAVLAESFRGADLVVDVDPVNIL